MANPYDDLNKAAILRYQAASLEAGANQQMTIALNELLVYIYQYEQGLQVCPQIIQCMNQNPWLKNHYNDYWENCAG
ncbi:MAG: hypothetical protein KME60_31640 [Cyanomargarita calcarea GSE-NOS-MK-12-04C]|jgi:hypothetical protein|uniref:Uncharacterized protein n=1 Tax=Cyanomargarita calcarea GSE-NOS-MK-12-04C TaxID=2839659 RepID=A0A951QWJ8_9CYAN|nr:hypothetical protein [Cyanomargarita calcarea GSE-NOS-MK-12-04C]